MLDMGEGFDVELAELTDIEQLNVCQVIIDAAKDNGIELWESYGIFRLGRRTQPNLLHSG